MIHRVHRTKDYSVISNYHLRDKTLTLKAKGLLSVFLSLPDGWDFNTRGLAEISVENKDTINRIVQELEEHKYVVRTPVKVNGIVKDWCYDIYEKPCIENPCLDFPCLDFSDMENEDNNKILTNKNTNQLNTNQYNPPISPFEEFWKAYPKKVGKLEAEKAFKRIKGVPLETIIKAIELQKNSDQWKKSDGQYIPNPSTWLNQGRWEDELNVPKENKPATVDKPLPMSIRR